MPSLPSNVREVSVAGAKHFAEAASGNGVGAEEQAIALPFVLPLAGPFGALLLAAMVFLSMR